MMNIHTRLLFTTTITAIIYIVVSKGKKRKAPIKLKYGPNCIQTVFGVLLLFSIFYDVHLFNSVLYYNEQHD